MLPNAFNLCYWAVCDVLKKYAGANTKVSDLPHLA